MIFTKDLLLKGLAGLALCTGTAALGVHYMGGFSSSSSEVKVTEGDLGLPADCRFPEAGATGPTTCNLTTQNVDAIKFDGKNSTTITGSSGTQSATLEISKDRDFPQGYLFTVSVPSGNTGGTLTINRTDENGGNIVINAGESVDFKVKKTNDGFSLEEAFTLNTLTNKLAGFSCANGTACDFGSTTAISIKQGEHTESKTKTTPQTNGGKIKVYSGEEDYNYGFKFVIEEGDISLTNGAQGTNITKLEQFETYEIKKEGNTWSLVRKHKAIDEIKTIFGLPENCTENGTETVCESLDKAKLTAIKFDGKGDGEVTINEANNSPTIKLKFSKTTTTNKTDFPHGFKFVLESNKDITIPQGTNPSITIKANTNTEFKIKKTGEGKSAVLTLEKAWTVETLRTKINLTGCTKNGETGECSFGNSINVHNSTTAKVTGATITAGTKINYELDQEDHNQGIKFYIPDSGSDITINGGTVATNDTTVSTISKKATSTTGPTYEIKEVSGTWYLAKKS